MRNTDFRAILRALRDHGVEFIVVGGVGAVLQGAPIHTFDLDVVHSTAESNVERLVSALNSLDAFYRNQPTRRLRPDASHLASPGHQLLMTTSGPLDLLGSIGHSLTYADLVSSAVEVEVADDLRVPVLDLEKLIEVKEATAVEKDFAVMPILRRTLEERRRKRSGS